jgi:hypothetical protein
MKNEIKNGPCVPGKCCWFHREENMICVSCESGDCMLAVLLEANTSAFHTDQLADATQAINKILSEVPPDPKGRSLSLRAESFFYSNKNGNYAFMDRTRRSGCSRLRR